MPAAAGGLVAGSLRGRPTAGLRFTPCAFAALEAEA